MKIEKERKIQNQDNFLKVQNLITTSRKSKNIYYKS